MTFRPSMQYLVDDLHSLKAAGWPEGEYWSTSTGLPYLLPSGVEIRSPEEFVDNALYQAFGKTVLDIQSEMKKHFQEAESEDPRLIDFSSTYAAQFYGSLLCIAYKALLLDRWLNNEPSVGKMVIGSPQLTAPTPGIFQFGRHDHIFAGLAAEFDEGVSVLQVPPVDAREFFESFNSVPPFDKVWNSLNRTGSSLIYKLARRFFRSIGPCRTGTLLIGNETEGIEECFLRTFARGWRFLKVDFRNANVASTDDLSMDNLRRSLTSTISGQLGDFISSNILDVAIDFLWRRMQEAFSYHPALVEFYEAQVKAWRGVCGSSDRPVAYLSSGLYAPEGRILDGCLRRHGIPVICMDHGIGAGLGFRHDFTAAEAISFSDRYLAFNREIAALYTENRSRETQKITANEAPAVMQRSNFPKSQRAAARKYLGIKRDERVLIYVTNLALNNVPIGYGTSTDRDYASFQRRLVDALAVFPGRVIVKPYPAHRYADAEQIWHMPLPANAKLSPFGEYRHIRWAADLVVLDLCSSTFGWAMNSDAPLIYIDNTSGSMTDRAIKVARQSVFYLSSMERSWERNFQDFLQQPQQDLEAKWTAKAAARKQFNVDFVNGGDVTLTDGLLTSLDEISQ